MAKKLIPFDYKKYQEGAKVVMPDAKAALVHNVIVMRVNCKPIQLLVVFSEAGSDRFVELQLSGVSSSCFSIFIEEEVKEHWINIYPGRDGHHDAYVGGSLFESEEAAKSVAVRYHSPEKIKQVKIEL